MAQYPIALSNLAAGLVNSAGDPEALVIQYPENYPRRFTEAQLNPILIPRHQGAGMSGYPSILIFSVGMNQGVLGGLPC